MSYGPFAFSNGASELIVALILVHTNEQLQYQSKSCATLLSFQFHFKYLITLALSVTESVCKVATEIEGPISNGMIQILLYY